MSSSSNEIAPIYGANTEAEFAKYKVSHLGLGFMVRI